MLAPTTNPTPLSPFHLAFPVHDLQQARRFVRRHTVGVAASGAVALALVVGGSVAVWQPRVAERERARADARFNDVRTLANAVVGPLYDEIAKVPGSTEARRALVKEALAYLDRLESQAVDDLDLKAELAEASQKIGDVQGNVFYPNLGEVAGETSSYAKLFSLRSDVAAGRPHDESAQLGLAHAHIRNGDMGLSESRFDDSIGHYGRALDVLKNTPGESEARVLTESRARSALGAILGQAGRHAEAIQQFEAAIALVDPRASAVPSLLSLQISFVVTPLTVSTAGSVIVQLLVVVQPLASVTVTVYMPAARPLRSSVVALLLHTEV